MSKKDRRHDVILSVLQVTPSIRASELAEQLGVSTETVRRDLAELDETGRIQRTYGGAVRSRAFEPALAERAQLHIAAREEIARLAVARIGEADSLFIGGGATTLHFARALRQITRRITVLTPAFSIATELCGNPQIEVMSLPGTVEPREGLVHGAETLKYIHQYRTPLAVMGASGVDEDGVSEALLCAAQVYSAMIAAADETLILADASKFENRFLQQTTPWTPAITLISDRAPPTALLRRIKSNGAHVIHP